MKSPTWWVLSKKDGSLYIEKNEAMARKPKNYILHKSKRYLAIKEAIKILNDRRTEEAKSNIKDLISLVNTNYL